MFFTDQECVAGSIGDRGKFGPRLKARDKPPAGGILRVDIVGDNQSAVGLIGVELPVVVVPLATCVVSQRAREVLVRPTCIRLVKTSAQQTVACAAARRTEIDRQRRLPSRRWYLVVFLGNVPLAIQRVLLQVRQN